MRELDPNNDYILDLSHIVRDPKLPPELKAIVRCPFCKSTERKQITTRSEMDDYHWRYYKCRGPCRKNYWIGLHRHIERVLISVRTPVQEPNTRLTGNLKNLLPIGHPALTPDYDLFDERGRLRNEPTMQVNEEPTTSEPSVTSISNEEDIDAAYQDFLEELEAKALKPQREQILPLFNAWLAHFHPELQTKEENTNAG